MTFWDWIEKLRGESEAKRQRVLWWSTSLITLLVIALWLLSWRLSFSPIISSVEEDSPVVLVAEEPIPTGAWANFKLQIKTGWQTLTKTTE